ncbi:MAG TPA: lipopolysaccharide biosynthesis protein [Chitinophagaceae bacterium]|nr:lipopolysaccharide biosynthesis protein [Chitinophagaceae bacterium]
MSSLRDKTILGIFWSFLEQVGAKGINFLVIIVLARILMPADFGLIAMLAVFIDLSQALINAGFGQALIQKKNTNEEDYSVVFYINLMISIVLYVVLYFCAPLIADFYQQPRLVNLTRVLSLVFVINAFSYIQETRLKKKMQFKILTSVHLPAILVGGAVGIWMGYKDFGVWSLVAFQLIYRLFYAIQIWIYTRWKPLFSFKWKNARELFSFGSKLMIATVINNLFKNAYLVVIGKFFPLTTLGYYENAQKLERIPSITIKRMLSNVTFSAFSSIQNDNKRLKNGYRRIMQQVVFLTAPVFVFAAILADPLFSFLLTDKWLPAVPFFQLLCIEAIIRPLSSYNLEIANVKGRSDLYLKLNIITKIIMVVGIVIAVPLGIWYLVAFQAVNILINWGVNSIYSGRLIQYPIKEQFIDMLPIFLLTVFSGTVVFVVDIALKERSDLLRMLIGFLAGGGIYWLFSKLFKLEAYSACKLVFVENILGYFKK